MIPRPIAAQKGPPSLPLNQETAETVTATTDNYGDFWLKGLAEGTYTLVVEKEGYQPAPASST